MQPNFNFESEPLHSV